MATIEAGTVDVFVLSRVTDTWRVLLLQRASDTRCPGSWESVHGHIEHGEEPEQAAVREVREETGLAVQRLYSVRVQPFYVVRTHVIQIGVGFAAIVSAAPEPALGSEHVAFEWLEPDAALARSSWPAERTGLREALELLARGDAGPLDDVLRVK